MSLTDLECRALAAIDEKSMVALLGELVRIPSITGTDAEHDIQHLLAGRLGRLGAEVDLWSIDLADARAQPDFPGSEAPREQAWGAVATMRGAGDGDGPTLVLAGHTDVVPPGDLRLWPDADPYSARIVSTPTGDVVHGRGACDMKAGIAAMVAATQALSVAGIALSGDLAVHCLASEEDGGLGAFATVKRGHLGDAVIITEPTSGAVVTANGGALGFTLHVRGRAAHGSTRYEGHSALDAFLPINASLPEFEAARQVGAGSLFAEYPIPFPISIGKVNAGDWASSVPDQLTAEGRFGVRVGEDPAAARAAFERHVETVCRSDPWLRRHPARVTWDGGQFASAQMPAGHPLLELLQDSAAAVSATDRPVEKGVPYGSDLRLYGAAEVPGVLYGPGDVRYAHAPREQVSIAEMVAGAQTLVVAAMRFCGVEASSRTDRRVLGTPA